MIEIKPEVVAYQVCAVPPDEAGNHLSFEIKVERAHHTGKWAVRRMGRCLAADGTWSWESIPSGRTDEWLAEHRFDLETALRLAVEAAPRLRINGLSPEDMVAWQRERGLI